MGRLIARMKGTVSIGDFSRMTHLSVKTLRHYHDVGLLAPAETDNRTGYRYYAKSQVPIAQVIRRFRSLGMPVEEVRAILSTPDPAARSALIAAHLDRLEQQLQETSAAVASLRAVLMHAEPPITVEYRAVPQAQALAISERVRLKNVSEWMSAAFAEIYEALRSQDVRPVGPTGALWPTELFTDEEGDATVFAPVGREVRAVGRARPFVVPPAELALIVHCGDHKADIDRTYGALGTHVAEHEIGVDGPVREYYLVDRFKSPNDPQLRTEIGWPIFQAAKRSR
ncbi:MAG TPA: MerR family transcriptional regulator [Polyangia bacterium]|nr:MerR family transcriptional regulator [Polyangia bacterium]